MSECSNRRCADELADGIHLCPKHTSELEADLRAVPSLWVDLRTTIGRMDATAASIGGGEGGSRPCINVDAWDKAETLEAVLRGWEETLRESHPSLLAYEARNAAARASRLLPVIGTIRRQEWAGDLAAELRASINECQHATDRAADRITLGTCGNMIGDVECLGVVRSTVGATLGRCAECRAVYDVKERQQWMIAEAWHVTGHLRDIIRWLDRAGHAKLNVKKVEKWVYDGKLKPESVEPGSGRPLYTPAAVMKRYRETPVGKKSLVSA